MAVSTADLMLMKTVRIALGIVCKIESASTTADNAARPNSKELHWNSLVVVTPCSSNK